MPFIQPQWMLHSTQYVSCWHPHCTKNAVWKVGMRKDKLQKNQNQKKQNKRKTYNEFQQVPTELDLRAQNNNTRGINVFLDAFLQTVPSCWREQTSTIDAHFFWGAGGLK